MIMPERESSKPPTIDPTADPLDPGFQDALVAGEARLSPEQALDAWHRMPIADLGRLADRRCRAIHGDSIRTYVIDRNINYTNVCTFKCRFCGFSKGPMSLNLRGTPYLLTLDDIAERVRALGKYLRG